MTVRLSALFEEHMQRILNNWKEQQLKKRVSSRHSFKENFDEQDDAQSDNSADDFNISESDNEESSSSEGSDIQPLNKLKRICKRTTIHTVDDTSDSNEEITTRKRVSRTIVSDDDTSKNDSESDNDEKDFLLSVSSRGRIRKLSTRVNAILKKR